MTSNLSGKSSAQAMAKSIVEAIFFSCEASINARSNVNKVVRTTVTALHFALISFSCQPSDAVMSRSRSNENYVGVGEGHSNSNDCASCRKAIHLVESTIGCWLLLLS